MEKKKKSKKWIIALCIIGAIIVVILVLFYNIKKSAEEFLNTLNSYDTAQVERRDLVSSISASGKFAGIDSSTVKSTLSGVVVESLPVELGDTVSAGQVICTFEANKLENNLTSAENTREEKNLTNSFNVSSAAEALRDAQETYFREVPNLEGAVDRTRREYEIAGADLEEAKQKYLSDQSQENANAYDKCLTTANNAFATYKKAMDDLETQKVSMLEAIEKAQYNLDLANMQKGNDTSGTAVKDAKTEIEKTEVTAPISGIITSVSVAEGDTYAGGAILTIEDCRDYEVSAQISEYDITKVKEGQKAVIRTNATGDEEFSGRVMKIAPKSTTSGSSGLTNTTSSMASSSQDVTYEVRISFDGNIRDVKLDMTAKVSIITEEKKQVLTVPYDAVQTDDEGNDYVEVVEDRLSVTENDGAAVSGQTAGMLSANTRKIPVERGIESAYYIEVISDELEEGMTVVVPNQDNGLNDLMMMMERRGPMGGM